MCICPVGLNGSSCESIVVENKVNAKCVSLNITLLLMYVRHKFVWIQIILFYISKWYMRNCIAVIFKMFIRDDLRIGFGKI